MYGVGLRLWVSVGYVGCRIRGLVYVVSGLISVHGLFVLVVSVCWVCG